MLYLVTANANYIFPTAAPSYLKHLPGKTKVFFNEVATFSFFFFFFTGDRCEILATGYTPPTSQQHNQLFSASTCCLQTHAVCSIKSDLGCSQNDGKSQIIA